MPRPPDTQYNAVRFRITTTDWGNSLTDIQLALAIAESTARAVRAAAAPLLDDPAAGDITGVAASGDTTFLADDAAEAALASAVSAMGSDLVCYSEDRGLTIHGTSPQWLLIVDPVDGTRPAAAGMETCAVSVAVARWTSDPTFADVVAGAVYELRRDLLYVAGKGTGAEVVSGDLRTPLRARAPSDPAQLRWTLEVVGRPSHLNMVAAGGLIDHTALKGAFFVLNSSAFSLCQAASGRFSGMVDISGRLLRDIPGAEAQFSRLGNGRPMGLWAYDIAAAALIAREAGCTITDAWGQPLDWIPLTRTDNSAMASCVCASSADLHAWMMEQLEHGFSRCSMAGASEPPDCID